jgi:hypothetical protein
VKCEGETNSSATVTGLEGNGGYSYSWEKSCSTSATATDLEAGLHKITITDTKDCTTTATIIVNPKPVLAITNSSAVCQPNTVDLTAAAVTTGSTSGLTLSYYTDAAATTVLSSPSEVTSIRHVLHYRRNNSARMFRHRSGNSNSKRQASACNYKPMSRLSTKQQQR